LVGDFITRQDGVGQILGRISSDIRDLRATLNVPDTDALSIEALMAALQAARALLHRADAASDLFGGASEFWSTHNLSGIASWANAENLGFGSEYETRARQLVLGTTTLGLAVSFVEPDEVFSEFRQKIRWPERSLDTMPMSRRFRAAS